MKSRLHRPAKPDALKCVRLKSTQIIMRLPTEQAHLWVSSGEAVYVPKRAWKEQLVEQKQAA